MQIAELFFTIEVEGAKQVGKDLQDIGKTIKNFGTSLVENVSKPIVNFLGKSVELASDIKESMNVVSTTFGDNTKEVTSWSKDLINKFGLTEKEALGYVGTLGSIFKAQGFTADETKGLSKDMTELTGDISSFYNLDHEDAFTKLKSGLTGEAEPLKSLGILVDDNTVKHFAMSNGLKENWKDLSQSEKMLWRYKVIMKQTGDSQGDFNKTQDSYANKLRIVQGKVETFAAKLGDVLIPVLEDVLRVADKVLDWTNELSPGFAAALVGIGIFAAAVPAFIVVLGTILIAVGLVVGAISTVVGLLSGITVPIAIASAAITIGLIAWAAWILALATIVAKLGIFKDAIASAKAIISGDATTMFELLHKNFGMSAEDADAWAKKFEEIADRAKVVWQVIQDNLGIAFEVIGEMIGNLMSGGMADLNEGTQESKNMFSDMVTGIIKWGGKLVDYLYEVFDAFGLIPVEMKFANNKVAGEYVRLNATTQQHYDDLLSMQLMFNGDLTEANLTAYQNKLTATTTAMDAELELVLSQLAKRKEAETTGLTELFENSQVLSDEAETAKLASLEEYYIQEEAGLTQNLTRQKEILTTAFAEKRSLTEDENKELTFLRESAGARELEYITTNSVEQRRILEESKNLVHDISKEQAMNTITQANRAYDEVVKKATEQKDKKIETAIIQRDEVGTLSKEEAENVIKEANWQYTMTTGLAEDTKDETIISAEQKYEGVLTAAEKEKRDVETQADKIKKILMRIWDDIKKKIPKIVKQMGKDIVTFIEDNKPAIAAAALRVGKALVQGMIDGIGSLMGALAAKVSSALSLQSAATQPSTTGRPTGRSGGVYQGRQYADGIMNAPGGWSLVGENGPEIMNVPKGADIYSNSETKGMLNNMKPNTGTMQKSESVNLYGDIVIDAHNVQDFTDVVSLLKNVKRHSSMR